MSVLCKNFHLDDTVLQHCGHCPQTLPSSSEKCISSPQLEITFHLKVFVCVFGPGKEILGSDVYDMVPLSWVLGEEAG